MSYLYENTNNHSFYINLPVGGISAALIFIFFKTPPQAMVVKATWKEKLLQMDPVGIALIMSGIITFILAVEYGGQKKPWSSGTVIGLLVGSALIWFTFIAWEYFNQDRAMLQRRIFKQRFIWMPSLFQFFYASAYFVLLYNLPIYFQSVDNRTAISSGVLNLPLVLSLAIGSTISGIVVMKTGYAAPFMVGGACLAMISAGLMYTFDVDTSVGKCKSDFRTTQLCKKHKICIDKFRDWIPTTLWYGRWAVFPDVHHNCAGQLEA
jgi:MFS family permease